MFSNKAKKGPGDGGSGSGVSLAFKRGEETKTYTPSRALTGDKRYGKENPANKDAKFIEDARANKQDISYKDGKPYRAGTTTTSKSPDRVDVKIPVKKPEFKPTSNTPAKTPAKKNPEVKPIKKSSGSSGGRLKPMAMTYGTDSPTKGGGTMYKNKVRAILKRR